MKTEYSILPIEKLRPHLIRQWESQKCLQYEGIRGLG
jgi:hypothetical protein